jgi:DnaJ-domain-containing protein 1
LESFIDRLADFLKSLRGNDGSSSTSRPSGTGGARYGDPDVQEAWEELDEYMRTGSNTAKQGRTTQGSARPRSPVVDESLRQDYSNLEVAFGADIETVRSSYKRLVLKYHPDRQGGDPEKQRISLEIMKKINQSFERIRDFHERSSR